MKKDAIAPFLIDHHMGWREGEQPAGKRIRPLLTLLTCHAADMNWQLALPAASAIEIIHNFSLIHDDIEDDSETRRGRPTVWLVLTDSPLLVDRALALAVTLLGEDLYRKQHAYQPNP